MTAERRPRGAAQPLWPRRLVALVASVLLPAGSGHLLFGRGRRGAFFFALLVLCLLLIPWLRLTALVAALLVATVAAFDAALTPREAARLPGWAKVLVVWLLIGLAGYGGRRIYRTALIEAFRLPSNAMAPTLVKGDGFFVSKAAYGLRLTEGGRPLWRRAAPARGDVVIFPNPKEPEQTFIKRVVGVEGDRVEVKHGELFVSGVSARVGDGPLPCPAVVEDPESRGPLSCHAEQLENHRYLTAHGEGTGVELRPGSEATVVPPGHVYVVGDHRDNSFDSRHLGPIPVDSIRGRALVRYWSGAAPRWKRIGTRLD